MALKLRWIRWTEIAGSIRVRKMHEKFYSRIPIERTYLKDNVVNGRITIEMNFKRNSCDARYTQ
jgi:hypothetical protein